MEETTLNDLTQKYSKGAIAIHWLTTILILVLFPLGKYMEDLSPADKMGLIRIHIILGIIVFVLTIVRTYLFFKAPRPEDIKTGSKFNDKLAVWIHNAFYFLLFGIALSGIGSMILGGYGEAMQMGDPESILPHGDVPPLAAHGAMATIMMLLLILHVAGVIKHYLMKKENTLRRMF